MRVFFEVVSFIGIVATIVFIIFCGLGLVMNHIVAPGQVAELESLRQSVAANPSEDVIGLAAQMNQKLSSGKVYNSYWFIEWFYPDKFYNRPLIDIPVLKHKEESHERS